MISIRLRINDSFRKFPENRTDQIGLKGKKILIKSFKRQESLSRKTPANVFFLPQISSANLNSEDV